MSLTVADLIGMPHLRLELAAGAAGTGGAVTWAHSSDLAEPWQWMTGGELLMKNGRSLPRAALRQAAFVDALADSGVSGLLVGLDPETPALSAAALAAAERREFPLLLAPYSVGFAAIGRAVADANARLDPARTAVTERVYNVVRAAVATAGHDQSLGRLARELGCRLAVVDVETGAPVLGAAAPPAPLRTALAEQVAGRHGRLPGVVHLDGDGRRGYAVEVPDEEPTVLVTWDFRGRVPDIGLLQHVATAVGVLLAQQGVRREHERRTGGELLAHLLDRRLEDAVAAVQLGERGLTLEGAVLVAAVGGDVAAQQRLHLGLARRDVPHLLLRRADVFYALLPADDDVARAIGRRLGPDALLGISDPVDRTDRVPAAAREAAWAARMAVSAGDRVAHYGDGTLLSVLRDAEEAHAMVDRTLRPLLDYDAGHGTDLVGTLETFLAGRRSWQDTAATLGLHRQTVIYRIRRVEELTGRDLGDTADIAELWLALRARAVVAEPV